MVARTWISPRILCAPIMRIGTCTGASGILTVLYSCSSTNCDRQFESFYWVSTQTIPWRYNYKTLMTTIFDLAPWLLLTVYLLSWWHFCFTLQALGTRLHVSTPIKGGVRNKWLWLRIWLLTTSAKLKFRPKPLAWPGLWSDKVYIPDLSAIQLMHNFVSRQDKECVDLTVLIMANKDGVLAFIS